MTLTRIISRLAIVCAALVLAAPALASAITSNGTGGGAWSSTATWVGAVVPVSGDSVTIAATDTVTFNVDQSGFAAGLAGLTINGTLQCSTTAGSYYLQMDGTSGHNITFGTAGVFAAGSAGTPLPTTVTFTVNLGGAAKSGSSVISGNGTATLGLYATNPTTLYTTLSAQASAAAGTITLVADVANDTVPWAVGDYIRVDGISQTSSSELFTIKAISSVASVTTITLGLASNSGSADTIGTTKVVGSYVVRVTRNIMVIGYNATGAITGFTTGSAVYVRCGAQGAGQSKTAAGTSLFLLSDTGLTFDGVISGGGANCVFRQAVFMATANAVVSGNGGSGAFDTNTGVYRGLVSGCSTPFVTDALLMDGAIVTGCSTCFQTSFNHFNGPTQVKNSGFGVRGGSYVFNGAVVFSNNSDDIGNGSTTGYTNGVGWGASLNSSTKNANYNSNLSLDGHEQLVIWDIGGVAGSMKAWMYAGRIVTQSGTVPTGFTQAYQYICEQSAAGQPVYCDFAIVSVPAGGSVSFVTVIQKDTNAMSETPSIRIVDPALPFLSSSPLSQSTMVDNTNTWQTLAVSWKNSGSFAKQVSFRIRAAHTTTANVYFTWTQNYTVAAPTVSSGSVQ